MARCCNCGKRGLFLKVNALGRCSECQNFLDTVRERKEAVEKEQQEQERRRKQELLSRQKINNSVVSPALTQTDPVKIAGEKPVMFLFNSDVSYDQLTNYVVVDIETTGLSVSEDYIIEISALKIENDEVIDTFSSYVKSPIHISASASDIHGITDNMIENAPSSYDTMTKWLEFVGDNVLVGHNIAKFDLPMIKRFAYCPNSYADTMKKAKNLFLPTENNKLQTLCDYFGIVNEQAHSSLSDCRATHQLYLKLKDLENQKMCSFTAILKGTSKAAQSGLDMSSVGDMVVFHYNEESQHYDFYNAESYIGYMIDSKAFRLNAPNITASKITDIAVLANGKKRAVITFTLSCKEKKIKYNTVDLVSNKKESQALLQEMPLQKKCSFIKNQSDKYICFLTDSEGAELGYVSKNHSSILEGLKEYEASVCRITENGEKLLATISIEYVE